MLTLMDRKSERFPPAFHRRQRFCLRVRLHVTMLDDRDSLLRRLHELRSEHRDLDTVIARLGLGIGEQLQMQRLKKRKLKLKDEISWLESRLVPDISA